MPMIRVLLQIWKQCYHCYKQSAVKPVLVNDIFSTSEAHILNTIEDAALQVLKKMKLNPKSSTIDF